MRREDELAELAQRSELALKMGGADQIRRQHEHGKLTARERVSMLADDGSFREFGLLAGTGHYEDHRLTGFTPKNEVTGFIELAGRQAVVVAGDFTIRGGSGGRNSGGMGQELSATRRALEWRVPYIRLLDAAGGSVAAFADMGRTYLPDGNAWASYDVQLLQSVPVAAAVLGSVAGLPGHQRLPGPFQRHGAGHRAAVSRWPARRERRRWAWTYRRKNWAALRCTPSAMGSSITSPRTKKTLSIRFAPSCHICRVR